MKKVLSKIYYVLVTFIIVAVLLLMFKYPDFNKRALEKEGETLMSSAAIALLATYNEFRRYPKDPVEFGFAPIGRINCQIYFSSSDLPSNVLADLEEGAHPFIEDHDFKLLAVCPVSKDELSIMTMGPDKVLKRHTSIHP